MTLGVSFFHSFADATVPNRFIDIAKLEEPRATVPAKIKSESPQTNQSLLDKYSATAQLNHYFELSHVTSKHPSSDDYDPDFDDSGVIADVLANLGSKNTPEAEESPNQDEEIFATPLSTPPHAEGANPDSYFLQRPDPVRLPQLSPLRKKRSYEDGMKPPLARKLTRSRHESQHCKHCNVKYLNPVELPSSETIPTAVPEERRTIPGDLHPSNSFDSATSSGTLAMTTSSTSWTRGTSSHTNSMTTSFNSSVDITDRSENFIHDRASQTIRPENENMEVERFVDTSCDVREFESMDIDDSDTILQERPGCVKFSPKKSILKDEYLAEQLFSSTLLSEHIANVYEMLLTPLICASSADVSKKTLCVISSIIRSD